MSVCLLCLYECIKYQSNKKAFQKYIDVYCVVYVLQKLEQTTLLFIIFLIGRYQVHLVHLFNAFESISQIIYFVGFAFKGIQKVVSQFLSRYFRCISRRNTIKDVNSIACFNVIIAQKLKTSFNYISHIFAVKQPINGHLFVGLNS